MDSGSVRAAFTQQPFHFLVIDVCSIAEVTLNNICCALSDVMAIAGSIRGSCRIPVLGLMVLQSNGPDCLMPLTSVKGNYSDISSAINELRTVTCRHSAAECGQPSVNCIGQCLKDVMSQFLQFNDWQIGTSNANDWKHLQITFVTLRRTSGNHLSKQIEDVLQTMELAKVMKIQVVSIESESLADGALLLESGSNKSSSPVSGSEDNSIGALSGMIDTITLANNVFELDGFFKAWLHDHSTDKEHLVIKLPRDPKDGSSVSLLCDIHEQLLNPGTFVFGGHFFISVDPLVSHGLLATQATQTKGSYLPVVELEAVKLVNLEGICESTVYGIPFRLQPTSCWRMEWSDLEANRQYFHALVQTLKERDCVLVVGMKQLHKVPPSRSSTMSIYFGLFASDTSLLIKSLASKELLLPPMNAQFDGDFVSDDTRATVGASLNRLSVLGEFNPVHFPSGLCSSLKLCLADTKAARQNQMKQMNPSSNLWGVTGNLPNRAPVSKVYGRARQTTGGSTAKF